MHSFRWLFPGRRQQAAFAAAMSALRERIDEVRSGRLPQGKRKVLEIRERGDGLEIFLHGQRFHLLRLADEEEAR